MNVAILETEQPSQGVAYVIDNGCNVLRKRQHTELLKLLRLGQGAVFCELEKNFALREIYRRAFFFLLQHENFLVKINLERR